MARVPGKSGCDSYARRVDFVLAEDAVDVEAAGADAERAARDRDLRSRRYPPARHTDR